MNHFSAISLPFFFYSKSFESTLLEPVTFCVYVNTLSSNFNKDNLLFIKHAEKM
jgi:hypothetical protein